jgi:hypothetical protein
MRKISVNSIVELLKKMITKIRKTNKGDDDIFNHPFAIF